MKNRRILISGAGIAGLTLAYFLHKKGFSPTVIEKNDNLRDDGYMIDFFSSGIYVAKKMGIMDELKKRDHITNVINQYTHKNVKNLSININGIRASMKGDFFNFSRTDLVDVLYESVKENIDIRFSTSIKELKQDNDVVKIIFDNNHEEDFDLLIAADGIHSNVRKLTYSKDEVDTNFLNYYVAVSNHTVPMSLKKDELYSMITPKRQIISYCTSKENNTSLFIFHSKKIPNLNPKNKIKVLKETFQDFADPVPTILNNTDKQKHLFFDEVSQIKINGTWHKERVALVGDAAYCMTLLSGQGASMAMTGAYVLAQKLEEHRGNYIEAFKSYEAELRPQIEKMQKKAIKNTASFLPTSTLSLWFRNLIMPFIFSKLFIPFIIKQLGAENYFKDKGL